MKKLFVLSFPLVFLLLRSALASVMYVPEDYETIQAAINAGQTGDTVLVGPGTYFENVGIPYDKNEILLRSTEGPQNTVIDGMESGPVLLIDGNEVMVDGFTIKNGLGYWWSAGGVVATHRITVMNCWIIENKGFDFGGGILLFYETCDALIINNVIAGNEVSARVDDGGYPIEAGSGAGINVNIHASAAIINNTIIDNTANSGYYNGDFIMPGVGGGINVGVTSPALIANNIIIENISMDYPAIAASPSSIVTIEYNDIWNNYGEYHQYPDSNFSENPLFVPGPYGGYYLSHVAAGQQADSPCIDSGNNTSEFWNLDFLTTRTDGIVDNGAVDLGYHYQPDPYILTAIRTNEVSYTLGDEFSADLEILNVGPERPVDVFIVLEVDGNYWFWPTWEEEVDFEGWTLPLNSVTNESILNFVWPGVPQGSEGTGVFWAAVLESGSAVVLGNIAWCEFNY